VTSFACVPQESRRRGSSLPDDCLFCQLYRDGDHVHTGQGVVAIRDINPKADVHLLVIPERHVETFRDVADFSPEEAKQMLGFIAEAAKHEGLEDYNVVVNVGPGAGQTIFHLHWHVLGGGMRGMPV
jgi:histidine triad (HIT) family protein